jgi:hypothetical protein
MYRANKALGLDPASMFNNSGTVNLLSPFVFQGVAANTGAFKSVISHAKGKWYFECRFTSPVGAIGICNKAGTEHRRIYDWGGTIYWYSQGSLVGDSTLAISTQYGEVWGYLVDLDNKKIWFNTPTKVAFGVYSPGDLTFVDGVNPVYATISDVGGSYGPTGYVNFGQRPFTYPLPKGYLPWNYQGKEADRKSLLTLPVARGGGF